MAQLVKKIKWQNILFIASLLSVVLIPYLVFAENDPAGEIGTGSGEMSAKGLLNRLGEKAGYDSEASGNDISGVAATIINGFLAILGIIFLVYMIHGGYLWMSAAGNDDQVRKAKDEIRNAIIGLIVIVAAYAIISFVLDALSGTGGGGSGGTGEAL
ncbi:MAG: pilin [Patescibacteria group bacterium]